MYPCTHIPCSCFPPLPHALAPHNNVLLLMLLMLLLLQACAIAADDQVGCVHLHGCARKFTIDSCLPAPAGAQPSKRPPAPAPASMHAQCHQLRPCKRTAPAARRAPTSPPSGCRRCTWRRCCQTGACAANAAQEEEPLGPPHPALAVHPPQNSCPQAPARPGAGGVPLTLLGRTVWAWDNPLPPFPIHAPGGWGLGVYVRVCVRACVRVSAQSPTHTGTAVNPRRALDVLVCWGLAELR